MINSLEDGERIKMKFRKLSHWCLTWINKLQDMKTFPTGAYDKRDVKINRLMQKFFNRR